MRKRAVVGGGGGNPWSPNKLYIQGHSSSLSAPAQMIFFPWGGWQLHWLIVNDKLTLSPPRVRGWLPAEYLPDSHADRLKRLYQHLPVGLSPDREPHPPPPHKHWWSRKARRCPEYSPSSCHHLNDASRGWRKDVGQSRPIAMSSSWYPRSDISALRHQIPF